MSDRPRIDATNVSPIHLAPSNSAPHPHAYVIHRQTQVCACCHRTHTFSTIYAETHLASRLERGKYITNLRPVQWPSGATDALFNLPIRTIDLKPQHLPFCHACNSPSLAHWPNVPPPVSEPRIVNHLSGTAPDQKKPAASGLTAKPKAPTGPKTKTLDDILNLL